MTTADPGRETEVVPVRGRQVVVRQLGGTQMMILAREAKLLQRDDISTNRKLDGVDRMFRILESVIVQQTDREYLEELMETGELELTELLSFVTVFQENDGKAKVHRARTPAKR